jgi:hypothetical protein
MSKTLAQCLPRLSGTHLASAVLASLLFLLSGCVDPYTPPIISTPQTYLVVDGAIRLNGVTKVHLSQTRSLSAGATSPVEAKATVAIQDELGTRYPLTEQAPGTYTSDSLTLSPTHHYQLRLRLASGREYASDLVAAKLTPAIDEVAWAAESNGLQIYVNSHDATNSTHYYRWSYQETWQFHSAYQSDLEYVNGQIQRRSENIYQCWRTENSTAIKLSSTDQLSQDVVSKFPLTLVPSTSAKIHFMYSILVQQYGLTPEEFAYWDKLRKNTESLGTLFDPLPSQLSGNVHSLDTPSELVLGYVGASSVTEKRIFIKVTQLPYNTNYAITGYEDCAPPDTVLIKNLGISFNNAGYLPIDPVGNYPPRAYTGASASCVDCRQRGTNVKPSFWP